jgi:hypothetical protein
MRVPARSTPRAAVSCAAGYAAAGARAPWQVPTMTCPRSKTPTQCSARYVRACVRGLRADSTSGRAVRGRGYRGRGDRRVLAGVSRCGCCPCTADWRDCRARRARRRRSAYACLTASSACRPRSRQRPHSRISSSGCAHICLSAPTVLSAHRSTRSLHTLPRSRATLLRTRTRSRRSRCRSALRTRPALRVPARSRRPALRVPARSRRPIMSSAAPRAWSYRVGSGGNAGAVLHRSMRLGARSAGRVMV